MLATVAVVFTLAYALAITVPGLHRYLSVFVYPAPVVAAAVLAARPLARSRGRERAGWAAMLAVVLLWGVADVVGALRSFALFASEPAAFDVTDLLYYGGYAGFIVALPLLTLRGPGHRERRALFDGGIVVLVAGVLGWQFLFLPHLSAYEDTTAGIVSLGYPALDLGLFVALLASFYGSAGRLPVRGALLAAASLLLVATDGLSAFVSAEPLDLGWIAAYWCMAGAFLAHEDPPRSREAPAIPSLLEVCLPYVAALPLFVITGYWNLVHHEQPPVLAVGVRVVALLILARQFLTLTDNRRLYRLLERDHTRRKELVEEQESLLADLARQAIDLERLRSEAQHLADHDPLTSLLNRRAWFGQAEAVRVTAVTVIDIDHFKRINDAYGHPAGDVVLREVAWRIDGLVGNAGRVGRLGGEEFGVFLTAPWPECVRIVNEVVDQIAEMTVTVDSSLQLSVTVSAGLAAVQNLGNDPRIKIVVGYEAADDALYAAKAAGRARLVLSPAIRRVA
jgi:diguanylate cyclase (GGDEF)-like protein